MNVHTCHALGCKRTVPPRLLMCARHWSLVPAALQAAVLTHYRPGQERDKRATTDYLSAAKEAIRAVARLEAQPLPVAPADAVPVVVCGSRDWSERAPIHAALTFVAQHYGAQLFVGHGACRGADLLAAEVARSLGWREAAYPADWERYGKAAGPRRNAHLLAAHSPRVVLAFSSRRPPTPGTADLLRQAATLRIPARVWYPGDAT